MGEGLAEGLSADFGDDLEMAFEHTTAEFLVISFSSDWHYPPRDSKTIINAMRANDVDVTYSDITADYGHDSFLMEDAHYHGVVDAYLRNIKL